MMVKGEAGSVRATDGVVMIRGGDVWMASVWFTQWVDICFPMIERKKILLIIDFARRHLPKTAKDRLHAWRSTYRERARCWSSVAQARVWHCVDRATPMLESPGFDEVAGLPDLIALGLSGFR